MIGIPLHQRQTDSHFDGLLLRERRGAPRRPASGHMTGVVSDPYHPRHPKRICALELLNTASDGLGTLSGEPLSPGARITLFAPPHGTARGMDLRGTVVRCRERSDGYEVGIALHTPPRAA